MTGDQELRDLFREESDEYLQRLDDGLLSLEKNPADTDLLQDLFRAAHNLKGAARMMGLKDIARISHGFEESLGAVKKGKTVLTTATINSLYGELGTIRKLLIESLPGELSNVDGGGVMSPACEINQRADRAKVEISDNTATRVTTDRQVPEPAIGQEKAKLPVPADEVDEGPGNAEISGAVNVSGASPDERIETYHIHTIRVDTQKLDKLMQYTGELSVIKSRVVRRLSTIDKLLAICEGRSRQKDSLDLLLTDFGSRRPQQALKNLRLHSDRESQSIENTEQLLTRLRSEVYEDNDRLELVADELDEGVRSIRMLPLGTIFNLYPRMVRELAQEQSKEIQLIIEGADTAADKRILEEMKDPLTHMIRNAVDHGIETPGEREKKGKSRTGTIRLRASQTATRIIVEIEDDGRGLDPEKIRQAAIKRKFYRSDELDAMSLNQIQAIIFAAGFSTSPMVTDISGRGVGMDVVREHVEHLKGTIRLESTPGVKSIVTVELPISLSATRVLIVGVNEKFYAIPVEYVRKTLVISRQDIFSVEGRNTIVLDGQSVSVAALSDLLELSSTQSAAPGRNDAGAVSAKDRKSQTCPGIIISVGSDSLGLLVDELVDEREVIVKSHSPLLKRVRNVSGATILGTGEVCVVLNPPDFVRSLQKRSSSVATGDRDEQEERQKIILVADDSITTRTQERRILESAGYEVVTAVDGMEAYNLLSTRTFDGVVSDVEMPNMDGLRFTSKIRQNSKYQELPVILVTSLASDEDKRRGIEVGANAYITKGNFDQTVLLETLKRLVPV